MTIISGECKLLFLTRKNKLGCGPVYMYRRESMKASQLLWNNVYLLSYMGQLFFRLGIVEKALFKNKWWGCSTIYAMKTSLDCHFYLKNALLFRSAWVWWFQTWHVETRITSTVATSGRLSVAPVEAELFSKPYSFETRPFSVVKNKSI